MVSVEVPSRINVTVSGGSSIVLSKAFAVFARICSARSMIDLVLGANRGQGNILQQLARLTDEIARGTLGSVIVHVRMRAARRTHAVITSPAPAILAQKSLGKRPCSLELARTGSAYKQIGVSGSAAFHRTCQKALDALLTR